MVLLCACVAMMGVAGMGLAGWFGWLHFRASKKMWAAFNQAHRELLGCVVAERVGDPRVSAMAAAHLTKANPQAPPSQPAPPPEDARPGPQDVEREGHLT